MTTFTDQRGFGLVETIFAFTLLALVLLALLTLLIGSIGTAKASRVQTLATQLANQRMEELRGLPYESIGILSSEIEEGDTMTPEGILPTTETTTFAGREFTIKYDIKWVDDSVDGLGSSDVDVLGGYSSGWQDYKKVTLTVSWTSPPPGSQVKLVSNFRKKQVAAAKPDVEFIFEGSVADGSGTPPDGAVIGGPESPYSVYMSDDSSSGAVPLLGTANDDKAQRGIVTFRFYVSGITPAGALWSLTPPELQYTNPLYYWDPLAVDEYGSRIWLDGTHEVMVEAWNALGARDAKTIKLIIDRDKPYWKADQPADLTVYEKSNNYIKLGWTTAWDGLDWVNKYDVWRQAEGETSFTKIETAYYTTGMTYYDTNVAPWTTYQYKLKAVSPGGRRSDEFSNVTEGTTYFTLTATTEKKGNSYRVYLTWTVPADKQSLVATYKIYRDNPPPIAEKSGSVFSYTDTIPRNSTHRYWIDAYDATNQYLNQSNYVQVTVGN
jgi:type II secretory pathway pseudopilin PulG